MNFFTGKTVCLVCGYEASGKEIFNGCPKCRACGISSNFTTQYDFSSCSKEDIQKIYYQKPKAQGLWTHREFLPISDEVHPVTIGEGNTPLIKCERLGKRLGLKNLYLKNESQNPTWSYKDRLCAVAVTRAKQEGAGVITCSSTGNHGASAAAMSASAGIPCVIFTVPDVPLAMRTLMECYGAYVVMTPTMPDRWKIMKKCVNDKGWYPVSGSVTPAIGSNPYGVDGYKTITFEIFDSLGELPDYIAVPTAYSDGLYGIWKGACDLLHNGIAKVKPRMIAADVSESLSKSLEAGGEDTVALPGHSEVAFSIGEDQATHQGYLTMRESNGLAQCCSDDEIMDMQQLLCKTEGIYGEASSVAALVAVKKLFDAGKLDPAAKIVIVLTSSGLKDPGSTFKRLPSIPLINPDEEELKKALEDAYHVQLL